jgi:hypothetical protein
VQNKGRQYLYRHISLQNRIACAIDLSHPARTQQAKDIIDIKFRARD